MATKKKTAKKAAKKTAPAKKEKARKQPENLRITSFGASLTVNDLAASVAYYRAIGFVPGDKYERDGKLLAQELRSGAVGIWLNQDDWSRGRDRVKGIGIRLYANTKQDVFAIAAKIKAAGGKLDHEPETRPWGGTDFGMTDPDGYKLTIQSA